MKKILIGILSLIFITPFAQEKRVFYGKASWYGSNFQGKKTASGEIYDINKLTAAHKDLPFGTILRVTNLLNGKTVLVKVNDRGPFVAGRVLDVSQKAAFELGFLKEGIADVKVEVISLPGEGKRDFDFQDEIINPKTKDDNKEKIEETKEGVEIDSKIDDIISNLKKEIKDPKDKTKLDEKKEDQNIKKDENENIIKEEKEEKTKDKKVIVKEQESLKDSKKFEQKIYKIFVIQLGAFTTEDKAKNFQKKLETINIKSYITEVKRDNLLLYKVREDKVYTDVDQALKRLEEINKKGIECFIVAKFFIGKE